MHIFPTVTNHHHFLHHHLHTPTATYTTVTSVVVTFHHGWRFARMIVPTTPTPTTTTRTTTTPTTIMNAAHGHTVNTSSQNGALGQV
jgi:hypothetical protein